MKIVTSRELEGFLESVETEYDVRVPIRLPDGTRVLGGLDEGPLMLKGGRIWMKPTSVFFPQWELVFTTCKSHGVDVPGIPAKPILVLGFTGEDLDCLEFIDKFFAANFRDDLYFNRREGAVVIALTGECGKDGEFMRIAGGKCDLELVCNGDNFVVVPYSEKGKQLAAVLKKGGDDISPDTLRKEADEPAAADLDIVKRASALMAADKVSDSHWEELSSRCIGCTSCNYVCPSCTCFDIYDRMYGDGRVERSRVWDSCQFDGFMREASGHNPMGTEMSRTRRRIHHRLVADLERWGHITCFLCGRCDDICPTGIGIVAVCREIVSRFGAKDD